MSTVKYVWLNLNTGVFSNSWDDQQQKLVDDQMLTESKENGWKLIKYECVNAPDFDFYDKMKIVTNLPEHPTESKEVPVTESLKDKNVREIVKAYDDLWRKEGNPNTGNMGFTFFVGGAKWKEQDIQLIIESHKQLLDIVKEYDMHLNGLSVERNLNPNGLLFHKKVKAAIESANKLNNN